MSVQHLKGEDEAQKWDITLSPPGVTALQNDPKIQTVIGTIRNLNAITPVQKVEFTDDGSTHTLKVTLDDGRKATYVFGVLLPTEHRYTLEVNDGYWKHTEAPLLIPIRRAMVDCHLTHHTISFKWDRK